MKSAPISEKLDGQDGAGLESIHSFISQNPRCGTASSGYGNLPHAHSSNESPSDHTSVLDE